MIDRRALLGMVLVCTAAGIGGLTVVMTRFVISETDPYTLASVRYLIASLCLLGVVFAQGRRFRTDPSDRLVLILLALVFFAAFPFCFAAALFSYKSSISTFRFKQLLQKNTALELMPLRAKRI